MATINGLSNAATTQAGIAAELTSRLAARTPFEMPKLDGHLASGFYERLKEWISDFEADLDAETEVGVRLVSFGQAMSFHLTDLSYWNPALIRFDGVDSDGQPVQLIQNVSQISILLMKVKKIGDAPRRIGFHSASEG